MKKKNKIKSTKGITMKEMCETIVKADILIMHDGSKPTAEQIYNYSSTGELSMVFEWYNCAIDVLKHGNL